MRRGVLGVTAAVALLGGAVGCSGGDESGDDAAKAASVAPQKLCGGAVSREAGKALEVITGSATFEESGKTSTVAHAADELRDGFASSATGDGDVCRIYTPAGTTDDELRVTWELSGSSPTDDPASKFTVLNMGERALTATDGSFLRFACRGGKLTGTEPAHIDVSVSRGGMPTEPEGNPDALKDAYATVAHSFSLAMAKELGCENNAGLPETPDLTPK